MNSINVTSIDISHNNAANFFDSESLLTMRRMITLLMYQNKIPRLLALVSALRREGVTYTTLGLGTVIASDLKVRVCAVDLNWHAPGLFGQAAYGLRNANAGATNDAWWRFMRGIIGRRRPITSSPIPPPPVGIAGILQEEVSLEDALIETALPGFAILPAGQLSEHERLQVARSQMLKDLLEELRKRFDYVLLDIPAILYTSDAIALASLSEAVSIVVRQGVTPINSVRLALDEIKHIPMLGVILNRTHIHTPKLLRQFIPQE